MEEGNHMQPMFKPSDLEPRYSVRPQPLEPVRRERPWVVPVALTALIVLLLIALVALAQQAPTAGDPSVTTILSP